MKRDLFTSKTISIIEYLKTRLPNNTYWCREMMKMLIYMADQKSCEKFGHPISDIQWYQRKENTLSAKNLEGVPHWEKFSPPVSFIKWAKSFFSSKWDHLSSEEVKILNEVVSLKNQKEYRIGSFAFRKFVFESLSNPPTKNIITLSFPETKKEQSVRKQKEENSSTSSLSAISFVMD